MPDSNPYQSIYTTTTKYYIAGNEELKEQKIKKTKRRRRTKMSLPLRSITSFRTSFSPLSPLSRPCKLVLALLQTPTTASPSSAAHIKIDVKHLPKHSKQLPEMTVGFRNGKEVKLEVGKLRLSVGDVLEEVGRIGRLIEREESLKG